LSAPAPFIESVFHASDFSEAGEVAFAHALAIALVGRASFTMLHAGNRTAENWRKFPAVRQTLTQWGLLAPGSPKRAVFEELSVEVTKIDAQGSAVKACLHYIEKEEPDLAVFATEGRDGLARWLRPSTAQHIARRTNTISLFVPAGCRPMVSLEDGSLSLHRILVPVDHRPNAARALTYATRAATAFGDPPVRITRLHAGDEMPPADLPTDPAWTWSEEQRPGDPVERMIESARDADLVIMATDGRDGPLDIFRGSHTERLVRAIDCPLLAVPSD